MKIFYSSGSLSSNTFDKNPSKSIGGLPTNVQILNGLKNLDKSLGIASLCIGGGEAVAMAIERMN